MTKTIFISYSWKDFKFVDQIEKELSIYDFKILRDVKDINYKDSLKEFMQKISTSDFAIILLSDSYLKSPNCLYEIIQLIPKQEYLDRVLHITSSGENKPNIFHPEGRIKYVKYWWQKFDDLNKEFNSIPDVFSKEILIQDLKLYKNIYENIGGFLTSISDELSVSTEELISDNFSQIIDNLIGNANSLYFDIKQLRLSTKTDQDQINIENLVFKYPKNYLPYQIKGTYELENSKLEQAINSLTRAIELNNNSSEGLILRAAAYLGQLEKDSFLLALKDIERAIIIDPLNPRSYFIKAVLLRKLKDFGHAKDSLAKAIELNPTILENEKYDFSKICTEVSNIYITGLTEVKTEVQFGILELDQNNFESALIHFDRALEKDFTFKCAHCRKARTLRELNRDEEALESINQFIEIEPENNYGYFFRANLKYETLKDFEGAESDFFTSITLKPNHFWSYLNSSEMYLLNNKIEKARERIKLANSKSKTKSEKTISLFIEGILEILSNNQKIGIEILQSIKYESGFSFEYNFEPLTNWILELTDEKSRKIIFKYLNKMKRHITKDRTTIFR